jgi:hypothetical protein
MKELDRSRACYCEWRNTGKTAKPHIQASNIHGDLLHAMRPETLIYYTVPPQILHRGAVRMQVVEDLFTVSNALHS